ncbi:MAG TPA: AI-2E family transporter [Bacteroidetes bacterium]|nr:AI-2E family transporter [Bacteroidota bacterium]
MTLNRTASLIIVLIGILFVMVVAKNFLIPIVMALCIWYIIVTISKGISRIRLGKLSLSPTLSTILATVVIMVAILFSIEIIVQSVERMVDAAPSYQQRFDDLIIKVLTLFNMEQLPSFAQILKGIDLKPLLAQVGGMLSGIAGNILLVIIYTIFLLLEQRMIPHKWKASFSSKGNFLQANQTMKRVSNSIREYLSVKTGMSLLTGGASYLVMILVGLDFAIFWAFLIFLLNFVPNIGSLIATAFPVLFSLLQFDTLTETFILLGAISLIQFAVSNFLEPRLLGNALNISGLVVLISLSLWGGIWGIIGMVLSVPLTVALMIILSQFPSTRVVAVWLSADGEVSQH